MRSNQDQSSKPMKTAHGSLHYDLAIIGGGTAGLTAANAALQLGARTALIEGKRLGGECTWTGCIPSKALISAARAAHQARNVSTYGVAVSDVQVDFAEVMRFVHATVQQVYEEETPDVLRKMGADVYECYAEFVDPHTLLLEDGTRIRSKHFLICPGAKPNIPPGFANVPFLTNETLFDLKRLPDHLIIVGAGPVGVEMAQAFRRLGASVTLIGREPLLLPRADEQASAFIGKVFQNEGIACQLSVDAVEAEQREGQIAVRLSDGTTVSGDSLLLAVGKRPNIDGLKLEAAQVEVQDGKLALTDRLRTSQPHIWAAGDVCGGAQFTHYAGWQAFQAVRNALLPLSSIGVRASVPSTTFTDPEIAQAGMTEREARAQHGERVRITEMPLSRADRAMTEGRPEGFMKLIHLSNGNLLGAAIVGANAGEMINDWIAILEKKGRVWDAALPMRVYPTLGTANVILATEQVKTQLAKGWLGRILRMISRISLNWSGRAKA
jgi:pyruvate/2-oxoglutarate dehydrogenase complex dihydrolipoamide dehydrogenase (E3) component